MLLKVLSLNSISVGISLVLGLFSSKIVSVFLGTSGMALLGSFRNFSGMSKSLATLGINSSVIKLFTENKENQKELSVIFSTFFWIFLAISSFLAICIFLFSSVISRFLFFESLYTNSIQFFGLLLPLIVMNVFWISIYNALEKFKKIILIQMISNVAIFLIAAILIWKFNIEGALYSIVFGEIAAVVITFLFIRKDNYFKFNLQKLISKKYLIIIKKFSVMSLLSAILVPFTLIFIRNMIVTNYSINQAGIWDALNRLSVFYMLLFSSGLSMYYMPRLASIHSDYEFRKELIQYFKIIFPLFFVMILFIYFARDIIISIAFTIEFSKISEILIWQLLGDLIRIATLAFGYQILVKTQVKRYFLVELFFNSTYFLFSLFLISSQAIEGVLKAYFFANLLTLILILFLFRKIMLNSPNKGLNV